MRLSRFFILLIIFTMAGLLYVRQETRATKIGYQINEQQLALSDTLDQRQKLLYNAYNLKSPDNLQESFYQKSEKSGDFQILGNKQIIILTNTTKKSGPKLARFFGITSLAEAKTQQ